MCLAAPRYWMVASVCLVMITTIGVEYVRVMFHPTVYTSERFGINTHTQTVAVKETSQSLNSAPVMYFGAQRTNDIVVPGISLPYSQRYGSKQPPSLDSTINLKYKSLAASNTYLMQSTLTYAVDKSAYESNKVPIDHSSSHSERESIQHRIHNRVYTQKSLPTSRTIENEPQRLTQREKHWNRIRKFHARNRGVGISNHLPNLTGVKMPPPLSLNDRGFLGLTNASRMVSIVPKHLDIERSPSKTHKLRTWSPTPDIVERQNFQQQQVEMFCLKSTHVLSRLPSTPQALSTLFSHLLYDDSKKIVFCYVPKNGCSNLKRLFLILSGILPPESAQQKRPSEALLKKAHSFRNLTTDEALYKLQNYYKFTVIRNPLERLLSAYRNKLEHPIVYSDRKHFPTSLQLFIMSLFRPNQIHTWLDFPASDIYPSFKEFVTYMKMFPLSDYNEHFSPFSELCHPCAINYDFYANFKRMDHDVRAVLEYLNIPSSYYPSVSEANNTTKQLMNKYYKLITWRERTALFSTFQNELNLYYALYPEESDTHKQLLAL